MPLPLVPWSTHSTMFPTHVRGGWTPGVRVGLGPSGWAPGAPTPPRSPRGRYSERRVFVGGLPRSVTDDTLGWFFSRWGAVEEANVVRDPLTGASRRFGFVAFARAESAATVKSLGTVAFSDTVAFNVADALHHGHATRSSTSATTRDDPDSRAAPSIPAAVHPEGVEDVARSASALAPGSGTEAETANANDAPEDVRADRSAAGERSRARRFRRWCRRRQPPCFTRARARTRRRRTRVRRRPARASRVARRRPTGDANARDEPRAPGAARRGRRRGDFDASWTRRERASV